MPAVQSLASTGTLTGAQLVPCIQRRNPERPKPTEPPTSALDFFTGSIRIDRVSQLGIRLGNTSARR